MIVQMLWQQCRFNGNLGVGTPYGEILQYINNICTLHHNIHNLYPTISFAQLGLIAVITTNGSSVFLGNWVGTALSFHWWWCRVAVKSHRPSIICIERHHSRAVNVYCKPRNYEFVLPHYTGGHKMADGKNVVRFKKVTFAFVSRFGRWTPWSKLLRFFDISRTLPIWQQLGPRLVLKCMVPSISLIFWHFHCLNSAKLSEEHSYLKFILCQAINFCSAAGQKPGERLSVVSAFDMLRLLSCVMILWLCFCLM